MIRNYAYREAKRNSFDDRFVQEPDGYLDHTNNAIDSWLGADSYGENHNNNELYNCILYEAAVSVA